MKLIERLFLVLWVLTYLTLLQMFYKQNLTYVSKEYEVTGHTVVITLGMLNFVNNKHELAGIIGHEIAHLELGHTITKEHSYLDEYHSDMLGLYYVRRAGFNPCGIGQLWGRFKGNVIALTPNSHPIKVTREQYMTLPNCTKQLPIEPLKTEDAMAVWKEMSKSIRLEIRGKVTFQVWNIPMINAFAISNVQEVVR